MSSRDHRYGPDSDFEMHAPGAQTGLYEAAATLLDPGRREELFRGESARIPAAPSPTARVSPSEERQVGKFFKALADPTRRDILQLLEASELSVGQLVDNFELSQPTISRHLAILRDASLVRAQRRGQHVVYRLARTSIAMVVGRFFGDFEQCRGVLR